MKQFNDSLFEDLLDKKMKMLSVSLKDQFFQIKAFDFDAKFYMLPRGLINEEY